MRIETTLRQAINLSHIPYSDTAEMVTGEKFNLEYTHKHKTTDDYVVALYDREMALYPADTHVFVEVGTLDMILDDARDRYQRELDNLRLKEKESPPADSL